MKNLVESILNKDYTKANDHLHEELKIIVARKLNEAKKMYAAKMSVCEQFGNTRTLSSVELAKRGLAEGDVVPLGKKLQKPNTGIVTHEGGGHIVVFDPKEDKLSIIRDGKPQGTIQGAEAHKAHSHFEMAYNNFREEGLEHEDAVHSAALSLKDSFKPDPEAEPRKSSVTSIKEEAKRAAIKSLQEKVRVRGGITPEKIKAAQAHSYETANNPVPPSKFLEMIRNKKSVNEEKVHNEKGEHIGDVMEITGSHAKDPTKTVKKYRAVRTIDGKVLTTANKNAAKEFIKAQ